MEVMTEQPTRFIDQVNEIQKRIKEARAAEDRQFRLTDEENKLMNRFSEAQMMFRMLCEDRGKRYRECSFDNYKITNEKQRRVVEQLREYAADRSNIENGVGILLYGTKGAGKDHLLMALSKEVARNHGVCAHWVNGVVLHADLKKADFDNQSTYVKWGMVTTQPAKTAILWVSDPLPPSGALSEYQQRLLFEVVDDRYSQMRPTWMTMNVEDGSEAESRMGAQNVDRLCHGALVIPCNWPSYRSPRSVVTPDTPQRTNEATNDN